MLDRAQPYGRTDALSQYIDNDLFPNLKTNRPSGQQWFIDRVGRIYPDVDQGGVCWGAMLARVPALLCEEEWKNETEKFKKRLHLINSIPLKRFKGLIEGIQKRLSVRKVLTSHEKEIWDILPFFESVQINHQPERYPQLFLEKDRPSEQDAIKTLPLTLPAKLHNKGVIINKPLLVSGVYSLAELIEFFECLSGFLKNINLSHPVPISFNVCKHSILAYFFDGKWTICDFNENDFESSSYSECAEKVMRSLLFIEDDLSISEATFCAFFSEFYVPSQHVDYFLSEFNKIHNDKEWGEKWRTLHQAKLKAFRKSLDKVTWLYMSSILGQDDKVIELLEAGANPNEGCVEGDATPLFAAALNGRVEIVELLVKHKQTDLNQACTDDGTTPLFIATQNGHLEIVDLLLLNKANPWLALISTAKLLREFVKVKSPAIQERMEAWIQSQAQQSVLFMTPLAIAGIMGHEALFEKLNKAMQNASLDQRITADILNLRMLMLQDTSQNNETIKLLADLLAQAAKTIDPIEKMERVAQTMRHIEEKFSTPDFCKQSQWCACFKEIFFLNLRQCSELYPDALKANVVDVLEKIRIKLSSVDLLFFSSNVDKKINKTIKSMNTIEHFQDVKSVLQKLAQQPFYLEFLQNVTIKMIEYQRKITPLLHK